jgi:hypothetical protein
MARARVGGHRSALSLTLERTPAVQGGKKNKTDPDPKGDTDGSYFGG